MWYLTCNIGTIKHVSIHRQTQVYLMRADIIRRDELLKTFPSVFTSKYTVTLASMNSQFLKCVCTQQITHISRSLHAAFNCESEKLGHLGFW